MTTPQLVKVSLIINALLIAAVVFLFVREKSSSEEMLAAQAAPAIPIASAFADSSGVRPPVVAFVDGTIISQKYELLVDQSDAFGKKLRSAEMRLAKEQEERRKKLEEMDLYAQQNPDMGEEKYAQYEAQYYALKNELDSLQMFEKARLQKSGEQMQVEVAEKMTEFLGRYAAEKGIDYVFNHVPDVQIILYGSPAYDVTNEVLEGLNKEYRASKELKSKEEK